MTAAIPAADTCQATESAYPSLNREIIGAKSSASPSISRAEVQWREVNVFPAILIVAVADRRRLFSSWKEPFQCSRFEVIPFEEKAP